MKVTHLRVNQVENPIGYDYSTLSISWKVEDTVSTKQIHAYILVSDDSNLDKIICAKRVDDEMVTEIMPFLKPQTRYYYNVRVVGDLDEATSDIAYFETGLETFNASFITPTADYMPVVYKTIHLEKEVHDARLYITTFLIFRYTYHA